MLFIGTAAVVFGAGLFAASIVERRTESRLYFQMPKPIPDWEPRNEVWGQNFPRQYDSYMMTRDTTSVTRYAGSARIDYLEKYPELVVMWAGYAFARDYNQGRGHYYAVTDVHQTLRTVQPQPATCWACKSSDVPRVMNDKGAREFYRTPWVDMGPEMVNPIGCADCHDPDTMNLRITRPALVEAFERQGRDIQQASHQEMRSLVCAQCHVEYYFRGEDQYLTFPWDKGLGADAMEAYFDYHEFTDWVHALSKAPMLKAQHPDYELYRTGVHAERGVACADCHMPYRREGGIKYTHHHLQSPLNNITESCQVCHRESEATLRQNVYDRQDRISELRRIAEKNLARVHLEAAAAWDAGATDRDMEAVLQLIRHAQWRWDWVAAANSMGFHSPNEALRVLGTSIQRSQEARVLLARVLSQYGIPQPVQLPDYSTKEKAQQVVGLDMDDIRRQKAEFLDNVLPTWQEQARLREATYDQP